MKLSKYISTLNDFQRHFGDVELKFWLRDSEREDDSTELELHEIHDGYNNGPGDVVCEIRLSETDE